MLELMVALVACPALLASNEAIRQGQSKDRREEHRARRCNLIVTCASPSRMSWEIDRQKIVLKNNKLYITTGRSDASGHPFAGYYLPYPDSAYEGIVSSITDAAPIMNWIYVDKDTYEVKYGPRVDAQPNITGPFNCTRQDRRMTLEGWEGFVAVKELGKEGKWTLYFDRDDDGLRKKLGPGRAVLEVELSRWEIRAPRPQGPQGWRKAE